MKKFYRCDDANHQMCWVEMDNPHLPPRGFIPWYRGGFELKTEEEIDGRIVCCEYNGKGELMRQYDKAC